MNVPSEKELIQGLDQQQHDHPIGSIVAKFVDSAIKKHSPPQEKDTKPKRRSSTRKRQKSISENSSKPS